MNVSPLPLAVFVVDADGAIINWNKGCEKLAGHTPADIRGSHLDDLIAFDDAANAPLPIEERIDIESTGTLRCMDGRQVPVRLTVARQAVGPGQPVSHTVIVIPRSPTVPSRYALVQDVPVAELIEVLPCLFYVIDQSRRLLLWNHQLEDALERPCEDMPNDDVLSFFNERDRPRIVQSIMEAFEHGASSHEAEMIGKEGKRTALLFHCARTSLGGLPCVFGTGLDISQRKKAEHGLRLRERAIYSSVNAIIITCCVGTENHIEYVNPAFEHITGYTLSEVRGRDPRFLQADGVDVNERQRIREALARRQGVRAVLRNVRKNGEVFWNEMRIDPVANGDGEVTHFVGVLNDITTAKHYERRLRHLAHHDALTGLANRTLLQEKLHLAISEAQRDGGIGALAFLDLDNFKHINDSFGHDAGDAVLREIARRLRDCMRETDTVARVGGDEFVLVIKDQQHVAEIGALLDRIGRSIVMPVPFGRQEIVPGTSIGVALFPRDGDSVDRVMRAADAAMYHAKSLGKNNCQFYSAQLSQVVHQRLLLEASLGRAIRGHELLLYYQPKVDLRSGRMIGAEALVRWNHPEQGLLAPANFIPVAEQTGLIVPLGDWVLCEACAALQQLRGSGPSDFVISVNLAARQLRQREFVAHLAEILKVHEVAPEQIELEVTESQLMDNPAEAMEALTDLKAMGVRLSIDDFGTGYSSLSYLQKFPVDVIKIDRSFLVKSDDDHAVIMRAIIALGHSLKLKVIAEGVETQDQLAFLRDHDCDQIQGNYFSPAVSSVALQDMIARDTRLPS
ncbi:EAL domain-containing protein [Massilia arenosa]|uniref:EAL domain-containing protein n=1 Tax=Zemynaea arenosa TaxID=2561931 RepID=A0A4Y9S7I9_9BURK|nr:EAL domain-containing protein [Massilia arenosa]TFW16047.1 EAL domain-containing protein [Massilia arenosa]